MRAAWARRTVERSLPRLGCAVVLIGLTAWGCMLDKKGGFGGNSSGPGAGGGGNGGDGGGQPPLCGNGLLDPNEQCDDGNTQLGDGCGECQVECVLPERLEGEAFEDPATHHCYLYVHDDGNPPDARQPWYDALYLCRAHGFELAAVTSPEERDVILAVTSADVWIGGNDQAMADSFAWTAGEPWGYQPWAMNEPGDMDASDNCVEMWPLGSFNDDECGEPGDYVCERHVPGRCGDEVIDPAEECDDGNDIPGDGCTKCVVDCEELPLPGLKFKDPHSHHCYIYEDNSGPWAVADERCTDIGFHLATMSSWEELRFLANTGKTASAWIGATDEVDEDEWLWSNKESWEFDPWTNDPVNGPMENCLRFQFTDLLAAKCGEDHPYLCEREPKGKRSPNAP